MKPKNHQVHFWTTLQTATSCLVVVSLRFFAYIWNSSTSWKSRVGGIPVSEFYQKKSYAQRQRLRRMSQSKWTFPTWALLPTQKMSFSFKFNLRTSNEAPKSEMFISTVKFDASVDVERMLFWYDSDTGDPTNPRFSRSWRISYICEKRSETITKQNFSSL